MSAESNAAAVGAIYEAFGNGDVPAILERLSEDVVWEEWDDNSAQNAGAPEFVRRNGRDGAAEFFVVVGGLEIHDFQVLDVIGGERQVAVEVEIDFTPPGGTRLRDQELHLWTFGEDGLVTRMRHYVDTAKHAAAFP